MAKKLAKRKDKGKGENDAIEDDAPMPSENESESSEAQVIIADEAAPSTETGVPAGTVLASAERPSASVAPPLQWMQWRNDWWFRSSDGEEWSLFRDTPAPVPGSVRGKGFHKGKRSRGTSPRYQ